MQKFMKSIELMSFKNDLNEVIKKLNEFISETNEDFNMKYNLEKYNQNIEGSDEDVLTQYFILYEQLAEVITNKNNIIKHSCETKEKLNELVKFLNNSKVNNNIEEITSKEKENNNKLKLILNLIVDKIIDKETIIFNKKEEEIKKKEERIAKEFEENQRKLKFNEKLKNINGMKHQLDTISPLPEKLCLNDKIIQQDKEGQEILPSFNKLKEWSGKQIYSVVFDSDLDGDGANNGLKNKVMNKKNLYFISFDNENNVFGGYIDTIINKSDSWLRDPNAFTFSLIRNGKVTNIKYNMKNNKRNYALILRSNGDHLYSLGYGIDIGIYKIGNEQSWCNSTSEDISYEYNRREHPFINNNFPIKYATKRLLVIEMN